MRRLLLSLLVLVFSLSAFPQTKHPFTFEDMMKLKRVGDPQVSPDGKVGDLQRGRCRSRGQHQDAAHLDRARRPAARSKRSSPIRTATVRAGRPMASASRFSRPKKADRKSGSRTSMAPPEP